MDRIEYLSVDAREWGDFGPDRLFQFLREMWTAGYKGIPSRILMTPEQAADWAKRIDSLGQPEIYLQHHTLMDKGKPGRVRQKTVTPFGQMEIEVVGRPHAVYQLNPRTLRTLMEESYQGQIKPTQGDRKEES